MHTSRSIFGVALLCGLLAVQASADSQTWSELSAAFQAAADKVEQAVVRVTVDRQPETPDANPYFNRPQAPVSGVLIDASGLVLTSEYNVSGTINSIEVELADGRIFPAHVQAVDLNLDLALLQVEAEGVQFPHATIDASVVSQVGRFAVVVGRTSFSGYNLTSGIISATKRMRGQADQLDALVSFGNAGGAVVDLQGRLLGIVSLVRGGAEQGQNSGVGFFAPCALISPSLELLKQGTDIARRGGGFLGVRPDQAATDLDGATIAEVIEGTAAEAAGMQDGDKIIAVNDKSIPDFFILVGVLQAMNPGDALTLTVVRGDQTLVLEVVLGERPSETETPDEPDQPEPEPDQPDQPDQPDSPDNPDED